MQKVIENKQKKRRRERYYWNKNSECFVRIKIDEM